MFINMLNFKTILILLNFRIQKNIENHKGIYIISVTENSLADNVNLMVKNPLFTLLYYFKNFHFYLLIKIKFTNKKSSVASFMLFRIFFFILLWLVILVFVSIKSRALN